MGNLNLRDLEQWRSLEKKFHENDLDIDEIELHNENYDEDYENDGEWHQCQYSKPNGNCQLRNEIRGTNPVLDQEKKCPYHQNPIDCGIYKNNLREQFIETHHDEFFN